MECSAGVNTWESTKCQTSGQQSMGICVQVNTVHSLFTLHSMVLIVNWLGCVPGSMHHGFTQNYIQYRAQCNTSLHHALDVFNECLQMTSAHQRRPILEY